MLRLFFELMDNPFMRVAVQIGGALVLLLLAVAAILRADRKTQRAKDAERDRARADRLRTRGRVASARELRPSDIRYRD